MASHRSNCTRGLQNQHSPSVRANAPDAYLLELDGAVLRGALARETSDLERAIDG